MERQRVPESHYSPLTKNNDKTALLASCIRAKKVESKGRRVTILQPMGGSESQVVAPPQVILIHVSN